MARHAIRLGAVAATALLVGACSGQQVSDRSTGASSGSTTATRTPPQPHLSGSQVKAVLADYDKRNDAAIDKHLEGDPSGWSRADAAGLLAADAFDTAFRKASMDAGKVKGPSVSGASTQPSQADAWLGGGTDQDGQGRWMLTVRHRADKHASSKGESSVAYGAWQSGSGTTGWKLFATAGSDGRSKLPSPGAVTPVSGTHKQAVANAISNSLYAIGNGNSADFADASQLKRVREFGFEGGQKDIPASDRVRISYDCAGWGDRARSDARKATLVGTQAVRMQRTGAMTLAMVTLDCDWTAASDKYQLWFSPEVAKVMKGSTQPTHSLRRPAVLMLLLAVPDSGKPSVLGSGTRFLLPRA